MNGHIKSHELQLSYHLFQQDNINFFLRRKLNKKIMLNKIWNFLLKYSFSLKLFFGLIVSGFLSSSFLASLSKLATYNYSKYYGIRFPLERIPYLKDAIFYGGFILTFIIAISFAFSTFVLDRIRCQILSRLNKYKNILREFFEIVGVSIETSAVNINMLNKYSLKIKFLIAVFVPLLTSFISNIFFYRQDTSLRLIFTLLVFLYTFISLLVIWNSKFVWGLAATFTLIIFLCIVGIIFHPPYYAWFLRFCKYGGGFPITLIVDENTSNAIQKYNGNLILRTPESYIIHDSEDKQIKEFRINNSVITYQLNSVDNYYLPR